MRDPTKIAFYQKTSLLKGMMIFFSCLWTVNWKINSPHPDSQSMQALSTTYPNRTGPGIVPINRIIIDWTPRARDLSSGYTALNKDWFNSRYKVKLVSLAPASFTAKVCLQVQWWIEKVSSKYNDTFPWNGFT